MALADPEAGRSHANDSEPLMAGEGSDDDEHQHFSHRAPWLRAFVLGANDGLVSVAALMLGVGGGDSNLATMRLAGIAAWIAGALSMAVGEYISVASQRDTELADIEKEREQQAKVRPARHTAVLAARAASRLWRAACACMAPWAFHGASLRCMHAGRVGPRHRRCMRAQEHVVTVCLFC